MQTHEDIVVTLSDSDTVVKSDVQMSDVRGSAEAYPFLVGPLVADPLLARGRSVGGRHVT